MLLEQFVTDRYATIDHEKLLFLQVNQKKLRKCYSYWPCSLNGFVAAFHQGRSQAWAWGGLKHRLG